jgi:hypothetical protein
MVSLTRGQFLVALNHGLAGRVEQRLNKREGFGMAQYVQSSGNKFEQGEIEMREGVRIILTRGDGN